MAKEYSALLGTVGSGIWVSADGGDAWRRPNGMWNETQVFALTPHPKDSETIFAGANDGIYRSNDRGHTFEAIDSPLSGRAIWSIAVDPVDADTIFAGSRRPAAVFRSRDRGDTWRELDAAFAAECPAVRFPRVLSLAVDPNEHNVVWAGAEVDGVRRSLDGGDSWQTIGAAGTPGSTGKELNDPDIHWVATSSTSPTTAFVSTPGEIFSSTDKGESWRRLGIRDQFPLRYCRGLAVKAGDPDVVFAAIGDAATGETGSIQRSKNGGEKWETLPLPIPPNSPMWTFATNPADPELILTCSHYGQVFISEDGGDSWRKVRREFTEIRSLAWVPN
jgi:photosystem II stability/assembly factor-like uncharacterized protein